MADKPGGFPWLNVQFTNASPKPSGSLLLDWLWWMYRGMILLGALRLISLLGDL